MFDWIGLFIIDYLAIDLHSIPATSYQEKLTTKMAQNNQTISMVKNFDKVLIKKNKKFFQINSNNFDNRQFSNDMI